MSEIYDVVIVGSGAGGSMMAYMLTRAGARVVVVVAGGHNRDRNIRHQQWPWECPYRGQYPPDPVQLRLPMKRYDVGRGERTQEVVFRRQRPLPLCRQSPFREHSRLAL